MPNFDLNGIDVDFPFEPYPCQLNYMKSVIESVSKRKNAILESPTGTGKTLCLLCSSISWLVAAKADLQFAAIQGEIDEDDTNAKSLFKSNLINKSNANDQAESSAKRSLYPKIIYASRTHSQLSQVISELKRTKYNNLIKACVIGSRDQLCINPQVNEQKSYTTKLNMCKAKVTGKTCFFYNNLEYKLGELKTMQTVDIEDLNTFGLKHKCCPYYTARHLKDGSDILFMPYNYLLDRKLRKSNNIDLNNAVLIFDEAHNVERVCEDSASTELSVTEIASAMSEINYILEEMKNMPEEETPFGDDDLDADEKLALNKMPASLEELKTILTILKSIEVQIDEVKLEGQDGVTKQASYVYELLGTAGAGYERKESVLEILQRLLQYFGAQLPNPRHHNGASLGKFSDFLQVIYSTGSGNSGGGLDPTGQTEIKKRKEFQYYKVHIKNDQIKGRILYYWCLCPGYSMQELLSEGARCIILTSGTLSPISTFKEDMKIPFDIILENPHIIKDTQIKVLALNKGPENVVLSSKYTNRDSESYIRSLGQLIINFSRIVPHGVLVFFPSYKALEIALDCWKKNNQWKHIGDAKPIFVESKGAKECNETVAKYYEKIRDEKLNGAVMFAVCRGKISEGIDFADNNGRAVIITGLPFPLYVDPRVILKRQFLDENKASAGQLWYNQQAYRAINQAVGRVIRHKDDYGAVILCDERFTQSQSINQLPSWMRAHVKKISDWNVSINELKTFFNVAIEKFPMPKIPNLSSKGGFLPANGASDKKEENKNDYINSLFNSYQTKPSSSCSQSGASSSQTGCCKTNFYDALDRCHALEPSRCNVMDNMMNGRTESSIEPITDFKLILQKRKEEDKKNGVVKTKIVIKESVTIAEAKPEGTMNSSKLLLDKISNKLSKEEYQQFKLALQKFHAAKKASDNEQKIKYYKALRSLFAKDLELFGEIEKFINFTGTVKEQPQSAATGAASCGQKVSVKRKFEESS